jgi:UDP-N-acetylmuramoyl-tripeptide--D-alanyl-D-alanine ligase
MIAEAARRAGMKKSTILEFNEFEPLLEWLKANLTKDDVVLVKGSHGLRMDRVTSLLEVRS